MKRRAVQIVWWIVIALGLAFTPPVESSTNVAAAGSAQTVKPAAKESAAFWTADIVIACDDGCTVYLNGRKIGDAFGHTEATIFKGVRLNRGKPNVIAVKGGNGLFQAGLIAEITVNGKRLTTSTEWKCALKEYKRWTEAEFDDKDWKPATSYGKYGADPWGKLENMPADTAAQWIWVSDLKEDQTVFFRYTLSE